MITDNTCESTKCSSSKSRRVASVCKCMLTMKYLTAFQFRTERKNTILYHQRCMETDANPCMCNFIHPRTKIDITVKCGVHGCLNSSHVTRTVLIALRIFMHCEVFGESKLLQTKVQNDPTPMNFDLSSIQHHFFMSWCQSIICGVVKALPQCQMIVSI